MSFINVDCISKTFKVAKRNSGLKAALKSFFKREYTYIDAVKNDNQNVGDGMEISTPESKVKLFVIPTNEELMIAEETLELIK